MTLQPTQSNPPTQIVVVQEQKQVGIAYLLLLFFGILVPTGLAYFGGRIVSFPGLIFTVRKLERRLHWIAVVIVAGLAVLLVHLALYPWPDLVRESTSYAGLGRSDAIAAAQKRAGPGLSLRTASRGEFQGADAWIVLFEPGGRFGAPCEVAVRRGSGGTTSSASPACRR